MSRISQDFINDLGFLYEHIHVKDQDFLNEESEYYDEETAELTEDIILSLALAMFSEGYTAETFVKFLASSDEEVILEKYLSTDINFISEEAIYDDFVEEQFELLEIAGLVKLLGRGAKAAASGIKAGAKATKSAVKTGVTKAATAGVEKRVGKQFAKSTDPTKTAAAVEKIAKSKASKSGISVPQGKLSPKQATELIKQARTAKAIQGVKTAAKGALIGGTGVLAGYMGAKLGGAGGDGKVGPAIVGPKIVGPKIVGPKSSSPSGGGGSNSSGGGGGSSTSSSGFAKPAPSSATPKKPEGGTAMQQWAKKYPELAAKVKPGQSGYEEISAIRDKPGPNEKQDQTPTTGKPEAQINKSSVEADIKAETERLKKKLKSQETQKEAFDIVIEYLIDCGHADTVGEACYIMENMKEHEIDKIVNICFG